MLSAVVCNILLFVKIFFKRTADYILLKLHYFTKCAGEIDMSEKRKKSIIICLITILLIIMPIVYINVKNSDIKAILLGIISSIIASSIFYIFSEVVFEKKNEEIGILRNMIAAIEEIQTKGILAIKGRSEFESDFWIEFAESTNEKWVISGRTLNRWLENNIREKFKKNILRILKGKGEINFIIYKNLEGEENKEKELFHDFLKREIFPFCVKKEKNQNRYVKKQNMKLTILEVENLPYLYNANEKEIIVAPYFNYIENGNNIMFVLKRSHRHGQEYSRDFQHIMTNAYKNKWMDEYLEERNGSINDNIM